MARTVWLRTRNSEPQARNEFHHRGTEDTKNLNGLELGVRLNGQRSVAPNPKLQTRNGFHPYGTTKITYVPASLGRRRFQRIGCRAFCKKNYAAPLHASGSATRFFGRPAEPD